MTSIFSRNLRSNNPILTIKCDIEGREKMIIKARRSGFQSLIHEINNDTNDIDLLECITFTEIMFGNAPSDKDNIPQLINCSEGINTPDTYTPNVGDKLWLPLNIMTFYCIRYILHNESIPITDDEE